MKTIICTIAIITCISIKVDAQTFDYADIKKNGVYVEVVYPLNYSYWQGYVSINYERVFGKKKRALLRLGIYPNFETDEIFIALPITISSITSSHEVHYLEFGLGIAPTLLYEYNNPYKKLWSDVPFFIAPIIYRYQKKQGLFIRGGFNLIANVLDFSVQCQPSLSLGYKF